MKNKLSHCNFRIVFKTKCKFINAFTLKDKIPVFLRSGIVYKFKCDGCNANYYGKTKHHFKVRMQWCKLTLARRFWATKMCLQASKTLKICLLVTQMGIFSVITENCYSVWGINLWFRKNKIMVGDSVRGIFPGVCIGKAHIWLLWRMKISHLHTHTPTPTHAHAHTPTCTCTRTCMHTHTPTHACVRARTRTRTHTHTHTHTHTEISPPPAEKTLSTSVTINFN